MCDPNTDESSVPASDPQLRLAWWSAALGIMGFATFGILSLPGFLLGLLAYKNGGPRRLATLGLTFSLISAVLFWPFINGPYLLAQVWPRYAVNRALRSADLPKMPSNAIEYQFARSDEFLFGELYVTFHCEPADAEEYMNSIPKIKGTQPIDASYEFKRGFEPPSWFTPKIVKNGWAIHETPWGSTNEGLAVVYDIDRKTMYIDWSWSEK